MLINPTKQELEERISRFFNYLNLEEKDFDTIIIVNKLNQYYFTGTMQDGVLILKKDGSIYYFVRKSFTRAKNESPLDIIVKINSYRDILNTLSSNFGNTYLETEIMPLEMLNRLKKYFSMDKITSIDKIILNIRSIKTPYEVSILKEIGILHKYFLEDIVPNLLKEGMSETDFMAKLFSTSVKLGHQGVSRFSMFQTEMIMGQIGFGPNSLYPTSFDGPGGMLGMYPAVPAIGNRNTYLKKGDLVFVDIGFGMLGYHSDKTQVYSFKETPSKEVIDIHKSCIEVLNRTVDLLIPDNIPSNIYDKVISSLPRSLSNNFMGYNEEEVKFLGHGVGLNVDEFPVIARGFNLPLKENMVLAIEPKSSIKDIGTVGVEETYLITSDKAVCLTGGPREIIVIK